jgi:hypothetical protein
MITMMIVGQLVEWLIGWETEILDENLPQCHSGHHRSLNWHAPVLNPACHGGKLATNHLNYGMLWLVAVSSPTFGGICMLCLQGILFFISFSKTSSKYSNIFILCASPVQISTKGAVKFNSVQSDSPLILEFSMWVLKSLLLQCWPI